MDRPTMPGPDPYEVLGLAPGASPLQIEKAYRFCLQLYDDSAVATYSLLAPEEVREARRRVEEAYQSLRPRLQPPPPVRLPAAQPADAARTAAGSPAAGRPEAPSASAGARPTTLPPPVTGAALRRCREERGLSLRRIADETKIGMRYLEYIEADRHQMLPALVYLRGFLQQYARILGLEPRATAEAYLSRVRPEA